MMTAFELHTSSDFKKPSKDIIQDKILSDEKSELGGINWVESPFKKIYLLLKAVIADV